MQTTRTALFAGAAAIVLAGLSGLAHAAPERSHVMTVPLPDGAIEQIRYTGDVPPQVILAPEAVPADALGLPTASFDAASPFALLQRLSAEMDQQAASMFQTIDAMMAQPTLGPGSATEAMWSRLPAGTELYSVISTFSGAGTCTRSMQITYQGNGQKPQVLSRTAGDCGASRGATMPAELPAPSVVPSHRLATVQAKNNVPAAAQPYRGLLHQVTNRLR